MKKFYVALLMLLCLHLVAFSQERTITGVIVDESDEPLPGVTVLVKGTTIGTASDFDGKYSINVPEGSNELVFSFIGFKPITKEIGAEKSFNITLLEDAVGLEEVVVTAMGIKKSVKALGYSSQVVETDDVLKSNEQNLITALSSKAAGVQVTSSSGSPGGSAGIRIRGNSTISGSNDPLIIVDGIYMDNSYNGTEAETAGVAYSNRAIDINPNDIADINILKGIAATALYGTRASGGAIIITTKKGTGVAKKGLGVEYRVSTGIEQITTLPSVQSIHAQGNNGEYLAPETGASGSWGPKISDLQNQLGPEGEALAMDQNGNLIPANSAGAIPIQTYNNADQFYRNGGNIEHYLGLNGGKNGVSFGVSGSYSKRTGIIPTSDFERFTLKASGDVALSKNVNAFANLNYVNSGGTRVQQGSNLSGIMLGLLRTPPSFDNSNGNDDYDVENAYYNEDGTQRNYRGGGGYDNPYWVINNIPFNDDVNRFFGNTGITVKPLDWLDITYRIGVDMYTDRRKLSYAIGSRNYPDGRIVEDQLFRRNTTSDLIVSATKSINDDLEVGLLVGHNFDIRNTNQITFVADELEIPGFQNASNALSVNLAESFENTTERRIRGLYAQASLNYKRMVYLTGTFRQDKASTFGAAKQEFTYPSATLSVDVTEALGISDNNYLSFAKVRGSWGQVGIEPLVYRTINIFTQSTFGGNYLGTIGFPWTTQDGAAAGFTISNLLRSENLKPELQTEFEIGTDLRFLKGRLFTDISYYERTTKDVLLDVPLSPGSGFEEEYRNVGKISNKGWEIILGGAPVETRNLAWDTQITFTTNKNRVEELAPGVEAVGLSGFTGIQSRAVAGEAMGTIFGGKWLRDDSGNLVIESNPDSPNYGFPIVAAKEGILGDPNPDYLIDFKNTLSVGPVYFSFLINRRKGGDMWNGTMGALSFFGAHERTLDRGTVATFNGVKGTVGDFDADGNEIIDFGNPENTPVANDIAITVDQAWYQGNGGGFGPVAETYMQDASWWRLREVSLGFNLPNKLLDSLPFTNGALTLTGRNLWLDTNFTGVDPDTNLTGQASNGFGLDYFNNPGTKSYVATLNLNF